MEKTIKNENEVADAGIAKIESCTGYEIATLQDGSGAILRGGILIMKDLTGDEIEFFKSESTQRLIRATSTLAVVWGLEMQASGENDNNNNKKKEGDSYEGAEDSSDLEMDCEGCDVGPELHGGCIEADLPQACSE